ncbi:DMT family transporter [Microbaculum marinum]|uniref:DMT family transporter n=1 Tax=Microbaculum marinum TaxID=1764581 RepID=A0AAW9S0B2_9HYPH
MTETTDSPHPGYWTETRRAHAAMLLFATLISSSFTVGGLIAKSIDPVALTFWRFVLAVAIFLAIVLATEKFRLPTPGQLGRFAFIGLLLCIYFVLMFEALRWTDPLSTGAVFTLIPAMTAVFSLIVLGQKTSRRQVVAMLIAGGGAVWVLFRADFQALMRFSVGYGEIVFFAGCIAYAAYPVFVRRLHTGESTAALTLWSLATGAVLLAVYGWRAILGTDWANLSAGVYLGILHLAVVSTAISFFLIKYASLRLPGAKVMAYTFLIPALVAVLEGLIGHGWPGPNVIAGVVVTALALAVIETG